MSHHNPKASRLAACVLMTLPTLSSYAWADQETWRLVAPRRCFFGGEKALLTIESAEGFEPSGHVAWSLEDGGRVLDRGMTRVSEVSASKEAGVDRRQVAIPLPTVREGIIRRVEWRMTTPDGGLLLRHEIWLYPREAFPSHDRWWETDPIHVFDPLGQTVALLESQGVPVRPLRNLAAIDPSSPGVVLVGQGVSLVEHPILAEALTNAARDGVQLLCLAPSEGDWQIEFGDATLDLTLRSKLALTRYDKRFDPLSVASPLQLVAHRGQVVLRCGRGQWSWLDLKYEKSAGRLLVCGLDFLDGWENSPVPRHLLSGMLKQLATNASDKETE